MSLEFKDKQFDGPYEVVGLDVKINNEHFKGVVYFPPVEFIEPHPVVVIFHGFPQLLTLTEIVKKYSYLLDKGYAFIAFNFRGYRYSQGCVSINCQVNDALEIVRFVEGLHERDKFDLSNFNIIAEDLGAYIALILASKIDTINRLLLICPIIDLKRHIYDEDFPKTIAYINRFLPGHVNGIHNINGFIEMTKQELLREEYQIEKFLNNIQINKLKIIIGDADKITPISEVNAFINKLPIEAELSILEGFDHDCAFDAELEEVHEQVETFF